METEEVEYILQYNQEYRSNYLTKKGRGLVDAEEVEDSKIQISTWNERTELLEGAAEGQSAWHSPESQE